MQGIVLLPESAYIFILSGGIKIENHKTTSSLLVWILGLIRDDDWNYWDEALSKMKNLKFQFEAVIDTCATELEDSDIIFERILQDHYDIGIHPAILHEFVTSNSGLELKQNLVVKIRNCTTWKKLHDEMRLESEFNKNIKKQIKQIMKNTAGRTLADKIIFLLSRALPG